MGLVNYYRRFVKGLSTIARPLQHLTQKDVPWVWTEQCQSAFELLKSKLITPPCLAYADTRKPFIVTTDASSVAIAFILSQKSDDGIEHVIEYSGRALRKGERNYGITDLEALAVIEGFAKYHPYLYGNFTTVVTDHAALVYMKNNIKTRGRLGRWALSLSNYNYEVVHRPGAKLGNADALSRLENYDTSEPPEEPMSTDQPDVCTISLDNQLDQGELMAHPISDDFRPVIESVMAIQDVDITNCKPTAHRLDPYTTASNIKLYLTTQQWPNMSSPMKMSMVSATTPCFMCTTQGHGTRTNLQAPYTKWSYPRTSGQHWCQSTMSQ